MQISKNIISFGQFNKVFSRTNGTARRKISINASLQSGIYDSKQCGGAKESNGANNRQELRANSESGRSLTEREEKGKPLRDFSL